MKRGGELFAEAALSSQVMTRVEGGKEGSFASAGEDGQAESSGLSLCGSLAGAGSLQLPTAAAVYDALVKAAAVWDPSEDSDYFLVGRDFGDEALDRLAEKVAERLGAKLDMDALAAPFVPPRREWKEYAQFLRSPMDGIEILKDMSSLRSDGLTVRLSLTVLVDIAKIRPLLRDVDIFNETLASCIPGNTAIALAIPERLRPDRSWELPGVIAKKSDGAWINNQHGTGGANVQVRADGDVALSCCTQSMENVERCRITCEGWYNVRGQSVPEA
jgi:hypothetical protein